VLVKLLISLAIAAFAALAFRLWYDRWPRQRLSTQELEAFIAKMTAGRPPQNPADEERIRRFQNLGQSDDGREFYMVNLIRYRKNAAGDSKSATGVPTMHNGYMRAWSKAALPRASHLIYRGQPALKLFGLPDNNNWDAVAIMRYRSRRDLFEIVTNAAFAKDASLKNVAVEYTDVYPSSVGYIIASPRLLLFLIVLPLAMIALNAAF
jgi:hypothetical protein